MRLFFEIAAGFVGGGAVVYVVMVCFFTDYSK